MFLYWNKLSNHVPVTLWPYDSNHSTNFPQKLVLLCEEKRAQLGESQSLSTSHRACFSPSQSLSDAPYFIMIIMKNENIFIYSFHGKTLALVLESKKSCSVARTRISVLIIEKVVKKESGNFPENWIQGKIY